MSNLKISEQKKLLINSAGAVLKKGALVGPVLFYAYVYFGLRWQQAQFAVLLRSVVGLVLLAFMAIFFLARAWRGARPLAARALLLAPGLLFLGILLSLLTRENETFILGEGESRLQKAGQVKLASVNTVNDPNFFLDRDQVVDLNLNGQNLRFGVLPIRSGYNFYHTIRFGFAPHIQVTDGAGRLENQGYVQFGMDRVDERYRRLVPRRPPPRLMLGVGTYPPELETLLTSPVSDQAYFIRMEKGEFNGRTRNLMRPDYYLWLTDGRVKHPVYRLMVWQGERKIMEKTVRPGEEVKVGSRRISIGDIKYWAEISIVRDYGLPLVAAALMLAAIGLIFLPLQLAFNKARRA